MRKKTYIGYGLMLVGIAVFTVYVFNTMHKDPELKGVVTTTTTQIETQVTSKADDKDTDKDKTSVAPVTTVPTDELEVTTTAPQFPMDINYATMEALLCVPNIGEKTAQNILDFIHEKGVISDMDMLLEINGIGEAKLNDLKRYFYVSDIFTVKTTTTTTTATQSKTTSKATSTPKQTISEQTTVSKTTAPKETKPPKTTTVTTTTPEPVRTKVNINTASAEELMACLLIDRTQAEEIVSLRKEIGGYTNVLEILYCDSISDSLYTEIDEYLET